MAECRSNDVSITSRFVGSMFDKAETVYVFFRFVLVCSCRDEAQMQNAHALTINVPHSGKSVHELQRTLKVRLR